MTCSTSAPGQKRTFSNVRRMSALPPKADIPRRDLNVCFGPKPDIMNTRKGRFGFTVGPSSALTDDRTWNASRRRAAGGHQ
jgi:hypothetical protein